MSSRLILTIIFLLASFVIAFFFVFPAYQKWRALAHDLQNARKEYQYLSKYYKELENLQQRLQQHESALKKIDSALPAKQNLPALFAYLQLITAQNGIVPGGLESPTITPSVKKPFLKDTTMELNLTGSYDGLKNLFRSLYLNSKLIDVQAISFSGPPTEEGIFDFKVKIRTYSY